MAGLTRPFLPWQLRLPACTIARPFARNNTSWQPTPSKSNSRRGSGRSGPTKPQNPGHNRPSLKMATRIVSLGINFFKRDGMLFTTPENATFFRDTGIEHDHGQMWNMRHRDANALFRKMGLEVNFSDRYVLNPYDIRWFDPRDEPWAAQTRSRYRDYLKTRPLWVHSIQPYSGEFATVRRTVGKRLASCVYRAAKRLEDEDPAIKVRGTVLVNTKQVLKAVNWDSQEFLEMMVVALREEMRLLGAKPQARHQSGRLPPDRW